MVSSSELGNSQPIELFLFFVMNLKYLSLLLNIDHVSITSLYFSEFNQRGENSIWYRRRNLLIKKISDKIRKVGKINKWQINI